MEWIEIKEGCEMPEIMADSRTGNWDWSDTIRIIYVGAAGKPWQCLGSLAKDVRDESTKFISDEGQAVTATHWKPLDWPASPTT